MKTLQERKMPAREPKHIYMLYTCETIKEGTDMFMTEHKMRQAIYEDFITQSMEDNSLYASERIKLCLAFKQFDIQVEYAFDHRYKKRILRRFLRKLINTLNHNNGAMQFVLFVKTVEKTYLNQMGLDDLLY